MPQDVLNSRSTARSERRLLALKEQARSGEIRRTGSIAIEGAPFPKATDETGYYGTPLLKEPQWKWEIPVYFFVGGAAGASAVVGAVANWTGSDVRIVRDAR